MLTALAEAEKIDALSAPKGPRYTCPSCHEDVVLKKGRIRAHHFAHQSNSDCPFSAPESAEHAAAKLAIYNAARERGLKAELEVIYNRIRGERRADVVVWSPKGNPIVFELQNSTIDLDVLEARASFYAAEGIRQMWIPVFKSIRDEDGAAVPAHLPLTKHFRAQPYHKWISGFHHGKFWVYDAQRDGFRQARMIAASREIPQTTWFESGGYENTAGGYEKTYRDRKTLILDPCIPMSQLKIIANEKRSAKNLSIYNWPAAQLATFVA